MVKKKSGRNFIKYERFFALPKHIKNIKFNGIESRPLGNTSEANDDDIDDEKIRIEGRKREREMEMEMW